MNLCDRLTRFITQGDHFALIARSTAGEERSVELMKGVFIEIDALKEMPIECRSPRMPPFGYKVMTLVPFRQVTERGFAAVDDGTPLLTMVVDEYEKMHVDDFLASASPQRLRSNGVGFDIDEKTYAERVQTIIEQEIGAGSGSNFVLKRCLKGRIEDFSLSHAVSAFANLLTNELGAYWTLLIWTGTEFLVGATPERHVRARGREVSMMPISGTFRTNEGCTTADLIDFIENRKETDELQMVVDEELKMMCRLCGDGATVSGPRLLQMSSVVHTAYALRGESSCSFDQIIEYTLFSPAVVGSPVQNACRVIAEHEREGRGYYAGIAAVIEVYPHGPAILDSAILIRTAYIESSGDFSIPVGATIVRNSNPIDEALETEAKAAALLRTFEGGAPATEPRQSLEVESAEVRRTLDKRNQAVSQFWFQPSEESRSNAGLSRLHRMLILDAEDDFTQMLRVQFERSGIAVDIRNVLSNPKIDGYDSVLLGPGPGDPRDQNDPRIEKLSHYAEQALVAKIPCLALCLGHQVLSRFLGFEIRRLSPPNQGRQKRINYFGKSVSVGFYNTFAAFSSSDAVFCDRNGEIIQVSRDGHSGEVYALRSGGFQSVQFHPESFISEDGALIIGELSAFVTSKTVAAGIGLRTAV